MVTYVIEVTDFKSEVIYDLRGCSSPGKYVCFKPNEAHRVPKRDFALLWQFLRFERMLQSCKPEVERLLPNRNGRSHENCPAKHENFS